MVGEIVRPRTAEPEISRYLHAKGNKYGIPVSGNFELTARCNFNCKMCYVHLQKDAKSLMEKELSADQWLSLASDARDKGTLFLLLTGGEPFLRTDFEQIYRELIKMGMVVSINTNASLYNEDLISLFRAYPPVRLNVSLYGGSEETYQRLCGNASFEKVYRNLKYMKEGGLNVRLNVSLTPDNVNDMEKIHEISKELNLQAKATSYMYPPVRVTGQTGTNAGRFDADTAGKIMARWSYLREEESVFAQKAQKVPVIGEDEFYDCSCDEASGIMCRAGRSSFWMTWDGKMLPCGTMDMEGAEPLKVGFENAWREIREKAACIQMPKECGGCTLKPYCGVCAANCKAETGEFSKRPQYLCKMTKSRCREILKMAENLKKG